MFMPTNKKRFAGKLWSHGAIGVAVTVLFLGSSGIGMSSAQTTSGSEESSVAISEVTEVESADTESQDPAAAMENSTPEDLDGESSSSSSPKEEEPAEQSDSEESETEPGTETETETESGTETGTESGTETETESGTETGTESGTETETESGTETETESGTETESESGTETDIDSDSDISTADDAAKKKSATVETDKSTYAGGETVLVTGEGWKEDESVAVVVESDTGKIVNEGSSDVEKSGKTSYSFTMPTEFFKSLTVTFTGSKSGTSVQAIIASAPMDVSIDADRSEYSPKETVKLAGKGWKADKSVSILVKESSGKSWDRSVTVPVGDSGAISDSFELPDMPGATYVVTATGVETNQVAETTFIDASGGTITVRKAGIRTGAGTESGLAGATFVAYNVESSTDTDIPGGAPVSEPCVTDVTGTCVLNVNITGDSDTSDRFVVVETSAPAGWRLLEELRTGVFSATPGTVTDYRFNVRVERGENETVPDSERRWANAKDNPAWPGVCGLNIALLFDQSGSIDAGEWDQMKSAASGFVDALSGTPSRISVFSFSGSAPGSATFPLASVKSPAEAEALKTAINDIPKGSGSTNWDAGLFQIATSGQKLDAVLVLTDGDPTVYVGGGDGSTVEIQNVEEAVHSANAIKSMEGTPRVLGVGIGMAANSVLNLAAISGPTSGSDYFQTDFASLDVLLREIALAQCAGTVTVEKQIGSKIPGTVDDSSNGWPFSAVINTGGGSVDPASGVTAKKNDFNGLLQFEFDGGTWPKTVKITETGEPNGVSGYTLADIECTVGGTPIGREDLKDGSVTLQIGIDDSVRCIFLNERSTGSLEISKTFKDGGSGYSDPFTIDYECLLKGSTDITGKATVAGGASKTISGIPSGYVCTVSESLPAAVPGYTWSTPSVTGSPTDPISAGTTETVTVANTLTRDLGSLELAKTLTAGPKGFDELFTLKYDCGGDFTGSREVAAGASSTVEGIPTGSECVVSEPQMPDAPEGYTFGTPVLDPVDGEVTIEKKGQTVTVTVANTLTRDLGSLEITKTFSPGGSGFTGAFTIDYVCLIEDEVQAEGSVVVAAGATSTVDGIPTGAVCTVTETVPAAVAGFTWAVPVITGSPTAEIDTEVARSVTVANALTAIPIPPPPPPTPVFEVAVPIVDPEPVVDPPPVVIDDPEPGEEPPPVEVVTPDLGEEPFPLAVNAGGLFDPLNGESNVLIIGMWIAFIGGFALVTFAVNRLRSVRRQ